MKSNRRPRGYWTFEKLEVIAKEYPDQRSFKKGNPDAYHAAHRKSLIIKICSHMPASRHSAYTLEEIQLEANKYTRRIDFKEKSESVYKAACRRDDYGKIVSHMDKSCAVAYTLEELEKIAKQHLTRGDFKNSNPTAHRAACRRNDYKEICGHMLLIGGVSCEEIELFNIVKKLYPNTKKLVDRKAKIENKPYIKGFDIDLFVSELGLGIEFDGIWTHSFEGLRRNREHWPDDDIRNYHEIKDAWFATKGIKILHIKQEDWRKDKRSCIDRCLAFLSGDLCQ